MSLEGITTITTGREAILLEQKTHDAGQEIRRGQQEKELIKLSEQDTTAQLTPALEKLNKTAPIFDFRFHFMIHEGTKRIMVQIIDQETGEVLNEIPPEKILDLVARIQELVGLLVDEKR
ncbi:MAG: flagellar protein FlaG [Firmicutes bacterium]|nr:flagellar protein FlaG [Bacillota bacterium]